MVKKVTPDQTIQCAEPGHRTAFFPEGQLPTAIEEELHALRMVPAHRRTIDVTEREEETYSLVTRPTKLSPLASAS